jgi:hypothetical protein
MKIALECKSPLMQKSLELFLQDHIISVKHCDIIIRDEQCLENKKCFYISSDKNADLVKPFSKVQLMSALEKRYKIINKDAGEIIYNEDIDLPLDFEILEKRIVSLTSEYQANILQAVKAFYEK